MKFSSSRKGFTLVETLVAVSILVAAITGPLATAARSLKDSRHANDQIAGYYLAQEVLEVIRSIRDANSFLNQDWMTSIPSSCTDLDSNPSNDPGARKCVLDGPSQTITACTGACPQLQYIDSGTNDEIRTFRQGQTGTGVKDSIYTRSFTITTLPGQTPPKTLDDATEIAVRVRISWPEGGVTRTFVLGENMLDWK